MNGYAAGDMMVVVKVQDSLRDMLMIIKLSDRGFTNVGKKCRKTSLVVVVNGQSTVAKRVPVLAKKKSCVSADWAQTQKKRNCVISK